MKRWSDVLETADHPRKVLPNGTLSQHRVFIEAAGPRIMNGSYNLGERCLGLVVIGNLP